MIRFHFDEEAYNSHWGGTSVYDILLVQENPLLKIATCTDYVDDFIHKIEWEGEVYPDYDRGICLYAGHDDRVGRLLQFSIPNTVCSPVNDIDLRLSYENFHKLEKDVSSLIDRIADELDFVVPMDSLWFRSRMGVKEKSQQVSCGQLRRIAIPYVDKEIAALPPPAASAGRVNRQGVSVLYLANEVDTAIAEIRPHPGHLISVGGFRALRDLKIANFEVPISRFSSSMLALMNMRLFST
ncbi:MAG: RES family NAD+ phosphorylase [Sphingomonadales bacterium]|nr:RES family NAD+ phosphorylase [Sphingomonadales bacterium]